MKHRYFFSPQKLKDCNTYDFDVVIVGSGIAGLYASLHLDDGLQCAVVTKVNIDESNSYLAQGGIAAVMSAEDNYINHIEDTLRAGAGLCNEAAVKVLVEEGPENIRTLIDMAIPFDINADGDLQITREGGHRIRRIVHCGGDATGRETTKQLGRLALKKENLHFFFNSYLVDILTDEKGVAGVVVHIAGEYRIFRSRNVIIATGGIGQIYRYTTNPLGAVGEGMAASKRAGAVLKNMEMVQFHPTTLIGSTGSDRLFLISEAVRGEGAILRNRQGEAFMAGKHEMADLAPRDIVTREILKELKRTGDDKVFLDVSSMSKEFFMTRFPTIYNECLRNGIDLPYDYIPVRPAQHYVMGGIDTDLDGQTVIKGLFSAGEAAHTGIHGANRLASNSVLECLVFGRRAAYHINGNFIPDESKKIEFEDNDAGTVAHSDEFFGLAESMIKETMSKYAGAVKTRPGMAKAKEILSGLDEQFETVSLDTPYHFKVANMLEVACAVIDGAIARKESVGAHYVAEDEE